MLLVLSKGFAKYLAIFLAAVIISSLFWNLNQFLVFRNISYIEDYDYIMIT